MKVSIAKPSTAILALVIPVLLCMPAYSQEYDFVLEWGNWGTGEGQFRFPAGIAVDSEDNVYVADHRNFRVQKFAPVTIEGLIERVTALADEDVLNQGESNSLIAKLDNALKGLEKGNKQSACNQIWAFIYEVWTLIHSGRLSQEQGQELRDSAKKIIEHLSN